MGVGSMSAAVADAGPLIHLAEVGCLTLLRGWDVLYIPDAVWAETVEYGRVSKSYVASLNNVQRRSSPLLEVAQFVRQNNLENLQNGECEALYLCRQISVSILLTDDLAVRYAAKRLNVTPVGSLGVIVKAYQLGYISRAEAERHITDLYDVSSLYVTRAIVELAVKQLRSITPSP